MNAEPRAWTGADLRTAREALGLTQAALADWLGWRQSRVSEAESGRRRVPDEIAARIGALEAVRDNLHLVYTARDPRSEHEDLHIDPERPRADAPIEVHIMAAALAAAAIERTTGRRPRIIVGH